MLARLTGTLLEVEGSVALVSLGGPEGQGGTAYEVLIPAFLAAGMAGRIGQRVTLHTVQYLEGQNQGSSFIPRLLGFSSARERAFFELLTTVKGLGNKRALRAMAVEPGSIARAIAERDGRFLQRLPEIGPKLAELIIHELKSKADAFAMSGSMGGEGGGEMAPAVVEPKSGKKHETGKGAKGEKPRAPGAPAAPLPHVPVRQAVDALIALGESPMDAEMMVARAVDRARSAGRPAPATAEGLLTAAYAAR